MKFDPVARRRLTLGVLGVGLLVALAVVASRAGPWAPTRVTVVEAAKGRIAPTLFGIGTVEARRSFLVGPTTAGRVRSVAVDVGDAVKAGQLLGEMDPVDLDDRLAALDASAARAQAAIAAAEAQHRDAAARRTLAAANARRYVELGDQNFISSGAVEARLQEQASAHAGVGAAQANLEAARQDLKRLAAERAGLARQRANVRLLAPQDGVIVGRDAEPGSTVVAGQAVVRMIVPSSIWVKTRLDPGQSAGLAVGLPARILLRSNPERTWSGQVARVEAVSDSVTEERVAQVAFDQPPPGISLGELAEVSLSLPGSAESVLLPNASLRPVQGLTGVWRIRDGGLEFVPVRLGRRSLEGQVQVLEGVAAGDRIVVHSERTLQSDTRVRVVDALTGERP